MDLKYIVIESAGNEFIIAFPKCIMHSHMAETMLCMKAYPGALSRKFPQGKVISAGFINEEGCYGRSESIGIESRCGVDTALLA